MPGDRGDLIQQVKAATDIVEIIGSYVSLQPAGTNYKGLCPFHDDRHPSFVVSPQFQNYRCWACGKNGDVISFVQESDRVSFPEALELLARRVGISLEKNGSATTNSNRAVMLEVVNWAEQQFQHLLLEEPQGEEARLYLGTRQLIGETVRSFGLGYAPSYGDWLVSRAREDAIPLDVLEQVGLIAKRNEGKGFYDRFRDRVMFPIRDLHGRTVGFGGRILPSSPFATRGPKYYNSCDTLLFNKSHLLYGLDKAKSALKDAKYLVVVEGYTDVLMAHQKGFPQVVATMGTALGVSHVQQLRRFTDRVILLFDADAGGTTGIDRAMDIFVKQSISLQIATLPEGMDPYDFLTQRDSEEFESALTNAQDVLEFKMRQCSSRVSSGDLESQRRAIDEILQVITLGEERASREIMLKRELMVSRIAQRFGVREESLWQRIKEQRRTQRQEQQQRDFETAPSPERSKPAASHERELLELMLGNPELVKEVQQHISLEQVQHPGLRTLLAGLYQLLQEGELPTLDRLRSRIDNPPLIAKAIELQERGLANRDKGAWLRELLGRFHERQEQSRKKKLQTQLYECGNDQTAALELLRQLRNQTGG